MTKEEIRQLNPQKENRPEVAPVKKPPLVERRSQMPTGRIPRVTAVNPTNHVRAGRTPSVGLQPPSTGFRKPAAMRFSEVPSAVRETPQAQPAKMARPTVLGTQNPPPKNPADKNFLYMIE